MQLIPVRLIRCPINKIGYILVLKCNYYAKNKMIN